MSIRKEWRKTVIAYHKMKIAKHEYKLAKARQDTKEQE